MSGINHVYCKVDAEDKTGVFRIKTEWEGNYFRLFVIEGKSSWFALVTREHIEMLAQQHELDADIYLKNLREYICNIHPNITFNITDKQFIVYRSIENEKFRIKYFFVKLEKLNHQDTVETFIDELILKYVETVKKLELLEDQKVEAESQKLMYEKKCEQFAELKRKSDLQIYSAFVLLLNEKKHRIRFLTEQLEEYQTGRKPKASGPATISQVKEENSTQRTEESVNLATRQKEVLSDSDPNHSDGYNTDDEKNAKVLEETEAVPGTSKDNFDFLGSDSPPLPSLPKRAKKEQSISCSISSSIKDIKQKIQPNGPKQEVTKIQEEVDDDDDEDEDLSFNTQDLLNRM